MGKVQAVTLCNAQIAVLLQMLRKCSHRSPCMGCWADFASSWLTCQIADYWAVVIHHNVPMIGEIPERNLSESWGYTTLKPHFLASHSWARNTVLHVLPTTNIILSLVLMPHGLRYGIRDDAGITKLTMLPTNRKIQPNFRFCRFGLVDQKIMHADMVRVCRVCVERYNQQYHDTLSIPVCLYNLFKPW